MRFLKRALLALVALIALLVVTVYGLSSYKLGEKIQVAQAAVTVPSDSMGLARGRYLARAITKCVDCHGESLGGQFFIDAGPVGKFWAPNLTRGTGGVLANYTDAELASSIRHGVARDGHKILIMPASNYAHLGDDDVAALIGYLRSVPPVNASWPKSVVGPLGRALYAFGQFPTLTEADQVDHAAKPVAPPRDTTVQYGAYLANVGGCTGCHGTTLSGGPIPGMPPDAKPAANLTPEGIGHYDEAAFFRALKEGVRPAGTPLDSLMPVKWTRETTDDDLRAIYRYLKTVPRKAYGGR